MIKKILAICIMASALFGGNFIPLGVDTNTHSLNKTDFSNSEISLRALAFNNGVVSNYFWGNEIIVDASGKGHFSTIEEALAYAYQKPKNVNNPVNIRVVAGSYNEHVKIGSYTILRGDATARSRILGSLTITGFPVFVDNFYLRSYSNGIPPLVFQDIQSGSMAQIFNCYILSDYTLPGQKMYGVLATNCNVWAQIKNTEIYVANRSSDSDSKSIVFGAINCGSGLELVDSRLKTSSTLSDSEYLCWIDTDFSLQYERSHWASVHDDNGKLHIDGNAMLHWADSSLFNGTKPSEHVKTEGTAAIPVTYYSKDVGALRVNGEATMIGNVTASNSLNVLGQFLLNGTNRKEQVENAVTNITDGVTSGTFIEATRTFDISAITGKAITNGMGGLNIVGDRTGIGTASPQKRFHIYGAEPNPMMIDTGIWSGPSVSMARNGVELWGWGVNLGLDYYADDFVIYDFSTGHNVKVKRGTGNLEASGTNTANVLSSESGALILSGNDYGPRIINSITNNQNNVTLGGMTLNNNKISGYYAQFTYSIQLGNLSGILYRDVNGNDMIFSGYSSDWQHNFDRMILRANGGAIFPTGHVSTVLGGTTTNQLVGSPVGNHQVEYLWKGSNTDFQAISVVDSNTLYAVTDDQTVFDTKGIYNKVETYNVLTDPVETEIVLVESKSIYDVNVYTNAVIKFNAEGLNFSEKEAEFKLVLNITETNIPSLTFAEGIQFVQTPEYTVTGRYENVVSTRDGTNYLVRQTWPEIRIWQPANISNSGSGVDNGTWFEFSAGTTNYVYMPSFEEELFLTKLIIEAAANADKTQTIYVAYANAGNTTFADSTIVHQTVFSEFYMGWYTLRFVIPFPAPGEGQRGVKLWVAADLITARIDTIRLRPLNSLERAAYAAGWRP